MVKKDLPSGDPTFVRKKKDFIAIMIPLTSVERGFFKKEDFGFSTSSDKASFVIYSGPQSYPYVRLVNNIAKERLGEDYHLTDALEIGAWGYLSVGKLWTCYYFTHSPYIWSTFPFKYKAI